MWRVRLSSISHTARTTAGLVLAPSATSATAEQTFGLMTTVESGRTHLSHPNCSMHICTAPASGVCATLLNNTLLLSVLPIEFLSDRVVLCGVISSHILAKGLI